MTSTNNGFSHDINSCNLYTVNNKRYENIYNQIDFVLCPKLFKHLLENARSYSGTLLTSDHKLGKTNIKIELHTVWEKGQNKATLKLNIKKVLT